LLIALLLVLAGSAVPAWAASHPAWVQRYNGPGSGLDGSRAIAVSLNGSTLFVTGASTGTTSGRD
jgi:hypothetical protein